MSRDRFKAAILDMDGVITRTADLHARAWKRMFDEFLEHRADLPPDSPKPFDVESDYRKFVDGKPRYEGVQSFLESRAITLPYGDEADPPHQITVCGLGNRKNELFYELLENDGVHVYPDAIEQVKNWKEAGWKVAVFSSSRNCEAVLKAANVLDLFDAKVDGNDLESLNIKGKPAPDMLLHAVQRLGVQPGRTVVVEDSNVGVRAGRAGGFGLVVGVARDRPGDQLRQAGADRIVHDLRELDSARCEALPSAMKHLDDIADNLRGKDLALFLDYDGTLTPIVRRPEDAQLSAATRSLLRQLAERCTVAIVSGRDRRDVEQMVRVDGLFYAGSHGFDIRGPHGLLMEQEDARQTLPELDAAEDELQLRVAAIDGARIERKKFAIALHYREVDGEEKIRQIEDAVDHLLEKHPALRKRGGKKIFELQPNVEWDKGHAVLWLTRALEFDYDRVVVLYIGDDLTDEDAFHALRRRGIGIGIRVEPPPTPTDARFYLRDTNEVNEFLQAVLELLPDSPRTRQ